MKKILAIDDQKDNLTTIKAVIKSNMPDCKVLTALSGKEGIEIAKKEQPDTILLDIIMPQMDGYDVCKRLKEDESTKHIPVVMITAIKTDKESRIKGLDTGADAFLSKPIDSGELSAQVNVMLRIKGAEDKLRAEQELLDQKVKERTKELRESEEKYRSIFEGANDGIIHVDKSIKVLNVNPAFTEITGISEEAAIGKSSFDLVNEFVNIKHLPRILNTLKSVISNKPIKPYELNYQDKILEISIRKQKNGQSVGIIRDITERKRVEERLIKSEERFRQITENSQEWIWEVDSNGLYTFASHVMGNMLGYKLEEIVNKKHFYDLFHPEDREELKNAAFEVFKQRQSFLEFINRNVTKNGEIVWLSTSGVPILDNNGNLLGYRGGDINITERKQAEEELQKHREHLEELVKNRTQKLEEQNKELARLNHLFVNREFRIKELRDKVKELENKISDKR